MSIVSAGLRLAVHAHVHVFRWSEALSQAEPPLKPSPIRSPQQLDVADHPGAQEGMLSEEELQAALRLQAILTLAQCRGIAGLYIEWLPKWVSCGGVGCVGVWVCVCVCLKIDTPNIGNSK